jgi:hypothetical protein
VTANSRSRWIKKPSSEFVDFNHPSWPAFNRWIGRHIRSADAKWLVSVLAVLSI